MMTNLSISSGFVSATRLKGETTLISCQHSCIVTDIAPLSALFCTYLTTISAVITAISRLAERVHVMNGLKSSPGDSSTPVMADENAG